MTLDARSSLFGTSALKSDVALYYVTLVVLVACYALAERIVGSRFGRVLGAIRQNPLRARAVGFEPFGYRLTAYAISGAMCATAGVLLANQSEFVSPAFMTWQRSGELLVMVILGGVGSLWGAILGAIAFLVLEELLSGPTEQGALILGPLLVLIALIGRGGLAGLVARSRGEACDDCAAARGGRALQALRRAVGERRNHVRRAPRRIARVDRTERRGEDDADQPIVGRSRQRQRPDRLRWRRYYAPRYDASAAAGGSRARSRSLRCCRSIRRSRMSRWPRRRDRDRVFASSAASRARPR